MSFFGENIRDTIRRLFENEKNKGVIYVELEDKTYKSVVFDLRTPSLLEKWASDDLEEMTGLYLNDLNYLLSLLADGGFMHDD